MARALIENFHYLNKNFRDNIADEITSNNSAVKILDDNLTLFVDPPWKRFASVRILESRLDPKRGLILHWPVAKLNFKTTRDEHHIIELEKVTGWITGGESRFEFHYKADALNPRLAILKKMLSVDPTYVTPSWSSPSLRITDLEFQKRLLERHGFPLMTDWTIYLASLMCLKVFPKNFISNNGEDICQESGEKLTAQHLHRHPIF